MDETEIIQAALRYGCQRLILLGNSKLTPKIFSLQPHDEETADKTLFTRASALLLGTPHFNLLEDTSIAPIIPVAKPKSSSKKQSTKKKQQME